MATVVAWRNQYMKQAGKDTLEFTLGHYGNHADSINGELAEFCLALRRQFRNLSDSERPPHVRMKPSKKKGGGAAPLYYHNRS